MLYMINYNNNSSSNNSYINNITMQIQNNNE